MLCGHSRETGTVVGLATQVRRSFGTAAVLALLASGGGVPLGRAAVWCFEAETAGGGGVRDEGIEWQVREAAGASGGKILHGSAADALGECRPLPTRIPGPGDYRIWVRYRRSAKPGSFFLLVRDEDDEAVAFGKLDWHARLPVERPYETAPPHGDTGWVWESAAAVFERPMGATLSFGALIHGGGGHAPRQIDCVVISSERAFDPERNGIAQLAQSPHGTGRERVRNRAPVPAVVVPASADAFLGVADPGARFHLGLINNASMYLDYTRIVRLGFNADHGAARGSAQHGVGTLAPVEAFLRGDKELADTYPAPEGRFANAEGETGRGWSLSFGPLRDAMARQVAARVEQWRSRPEVEHWRISGETAGWLDYSTPSQVAFRTWLAKRYGTVADLNRVWGGDHASFDHVIPPKDVQDNKAGWLDFREFCGQTFAEAVAAQLPIIRRLDPQQRPCIGQNSNLDLLAAYFTSLRPMDWEQYIDVALADQPCVGWDTYCADDYLGCEVDLLQSLAGDKALINEEWNTHATDWRIAARTFWTMVGKGVKGIYCFQFQEGTHHDSYPKWALLRGDLAPKDKLGAFADCAQEVHRLERFLVDARRRDAVKPVALYYSRIDLSLDRPLASTWGEGVDSPYRVYEILRGLGYTVRWITPKQIEAGHLDAVAAVVLVNAQHIPSAAAAALADWVRGGGAVIGDTWPGAFDEHGRPQDALAAVFGVRAPRPGPTPRVSGKLALQESSQGYGEVTIAALEPDERHKTVGEMWQQWDATHAVAREVGPYMLSGFGLQRVECTAGQVVGMTFGGRPGVVVNEPGAGHAMYVAMLLGSLYSGSATRFEWDTTHSGLDAHRLVGAFLRHAGAEPASTADLPARLKAKLRVEAPLVDSRGNVVVGITSLNDLPLESFALTLRWPTGVAPPRRAFVALGGGRRLTIVPHLTRGGSVGVRMPPFHTHATLLLLQRSEPLLGLKAAGATRGTAALLHVRPGDRLVLTATVHNPCDERRPPGHVTLHVPRGWTSDCHSRKVRPIKPWGSRSVHFTVTAPGVCAARRLRPILVRYHAGACSSTPTTELVWWEPAP